MALISANWLNEQINLFFDKRIFQTTTQTTGMDFRNWITRKKDGCSMTGVTITLRITSQKGEGASGKTAMDFNGTEYYSGNYLPI